MTFPVLAGAVLVGHFVAPGLLWLLGIVTRGLRERITGGLVAAGTLLVLLTAAIFFGLVWGWWTLITVHNVFGWLGGCLSILLVILVVGWFYTLGRAFRNGERRLPYSHEDTADVG